VDDRSGSMKAAGDGPDKTGDDTNLKNIKFDAADRGWVVMSIGMAVGAGIVFLPVEVGIMGIWVFLISAVIAYPALFLFQRLFINTLVASETCRDYTGIISEYLGKNWGIVLGLLYFAMQVIWVFVYSESVTNDSASYLHTYGVTKTVWSKNPLYGLVLIIALVLVASKSEKLLFKLSGFMATSVLLIVLALGLLIVPNWRIENIAPFPPAGQLIKNAIITLPFSLTSILFLQSLSPMVISFREKNLSAEVARFKAQRAMRIAFILLFCVVFFYAISFSLSISQENAKEAYDQNISSLALIAQHIPGKSVHIVGVVVDLFAIVTSFFAVFLAFREACTGIVLNVLKRKYADDRINRKRISIGVTLFIILLPWCAVMLNIPILDFTSICSPIFGIVGCLIPAILVYRVPGLHQYKGVATYITIITGLLLLISPLLAFWK
jgi:cysteine uptake transport protein